MNPVLNIYIMATSNNQNHRVVRRRIIIIRRVPFFLVFWAFLFHSEKLHPILHKPSTANTDAWFSQSQYSMMGVYTMGDDGRDSFSGGSSMGYEEEEEKSLLERLVTTNPYQSPTRYPLRN